MNIEHGDIRYPSSFLREDAIAIASQARHRRTLLGVGALAVGLEVLNGLGGFELSEVWFWASKVLFLVVIGLLGFELIASHAEKLEVPWYDARAAAESTKTLYWRFLVGGDPFPSALHQEEAEALLTQRIGRVMIELGKRGPGSVEIIEPDTMTWARTIRARPLPERITFYRRLRIENQESWYANKARHLSTLAKRFLGLAIASATCAFVLAAGVLVGNAVDSSASEVLKKMGSFSGVFLQSAVVLFGYSAIRNYRRDSRAYEVTRSEIVAIASLVTDDLTESQWGKLVDEIEEVFSREHVTWHASHSGEIKLASTGSSEPS